MTFDPKAWRPSIASALILAAALALVGRPATAQLLISTADGSSSLKLGTLVQFWAESLDTPDAQEQQRNLYFRRLRLLGQYQFGDRLSLFWETDSPNLGKGNPDGSKNSGTSVSFLDVVATYAFAHQFQLDAGEILVPVSYNHLQAAGALLPLDYGPFSFTESVALGANVGRDWGAQLRGYLASDHLEYRVGVFQGQRGANDTNDFRYAGRLALYVFGAETGLFYRGTSLGKLATLSVGGSFDRQREYSAYSGDVFWDQPVGHGDGFTLQFDYTKWDGGTFLAAVPKQKTILAEAGYYLGAIKTQPFFQYGQEDFAANGLADQKRYSFGLAYYFVGRTSDLKFAYTELKATNAPNRSQYQLQYQVFIW
jgi:Phosphate-selective porin O and P